MLDLIWKIPMWIGIVLGVIFLIISIGAGLILFAMFALIVLSLAAVVNGPRTAWAKRKLRRRRAADHLTQRPSYHEST